MKLFSQPSNEDDGPIKEYDNVSDWIASVQPPIEQAPTQTADKSVATHSGRDAKKWFRH